MDARQEALLMKISEYEFVCVELNEYLDTHPRDMDARADFVCYAKALGDLIAAYEAEYAPLLNFGHSATAVGCWVCSKWPWQL